MIISSRPLVINALQYQENSSGIGIMTKELFEAVCARIQCPCTVVLAKNSPEFTVDNPLVEVVRIPYERKDSFRRLWFQSFQLGRMCRGKTLLVIDSKIPLLFPKSAKLVSIITDLAVYRLRDTYQLSRVLLWRFQFRILKRRADRLCAISEFTKREMVELLDIATERIQIVPCAANTSIHRVENQNALVEVRQKYQLPVNYVLFVGNFNPRKNLMRAIEAFVRMKNRTGLPHKLVIAGAGGWKLDMKALLERVDCKDDIFFPGYVADEDMSALYTMADVFLFPTLYEGFGIPIIEAQQCGTPVLAANVSAMPEVAGDSACYADPYSVEDIARKLEDILKDKSLSDKLRIKGYENVKRFTWEKSAEKLKQCIENV